MDKQKDRTVVVEFWDVASPHSMRTLPYLKEWHRRYWQHGLRVIAVHTPAIPETADETVVTDAVARLGIEYPVVVDAEREIWQLYGARGYPTRYIWERGLKLVDMHEGEGAYGESERIIQGLVGVDGELTGPLRPEEEEGASLAMPTAPVEGAFSGTYEAGGVWVVYSGEGCILVDGDEVEVTGVGTVEVASHPTHTASRITVEPSDGVHVIETRFTPGLLAG